jgi:uncharacterized protein YqjF (DUF2071 family)
MTEGAKTTPTIADRLRLREERPAGMPLMHQSWDCLLFLHWKVEPALLRSFIPEPLSIDTFEGNAWLTISPFTIYDVRPAFLPRLPVDFGFHELNVRTYVHLDGDSGVWFFSLDANSSLAVYGARMFYYLPYFTASIDFDPGSEKKTFISRRSDQTARFSAAWQVGASLTAAEPGTLDFFLVERYQLFTERDGALYRCRIHHDPWPLQQANLISSPQSSMAEACGLPRPATKPVARCAGPVSVDIWPLEMVEKRV